MRKNVFQLTKIMDWKKLVRYQIIIMKAACFEIVFIEAPKREFWVKCLICNSSAQKQYSRAQEEEYVCDFCGNSLHFELFEHKVLIF